MSGLKIRTARKQHRCDGYPCDTPIRPGERYEIHSAPPGHLCHATGCKQAVPPRMFMCRTHWYRLPKAMRDAIWAAYRPGQEIRKDPTPEYLAVARRCIAYLAQRDGPAR